MNASQMTFGIEIETTLPADTSVVTGHHGNGREITSVDLPGWKADRDPSIAASCGRVPCEFVSPIYRGAEGLAKMMQDIRIIKALGAETNSSCGLHVHVGFDRHDEKSLQRLTTLVSNFETAIYASTGTKNRERGRWCGSIRRHGNAATAIQQSGYNRYHIVNLGSEHPTVEFRPFAASLNPQKIAGYVAMCVAIAERATAAKRVSKWVAKPTSATSPIHRNGEGQTHLTRFFYTMGWIKGRVDYTFGNIFPDVRAIKRQLMAMARKYDKQS